MSSLKRKVLGVDLSRRVRARRESSQELESIGTAPSINGNGAATDEELSDVVEENIEKDEPESSESEASDGMACISFGALAKARATLTKTGKPAESSSEYPNNAAGDDTWDDKEASERKAGRKDHRDFNRRSKHAPSEISSKKAVSRKREVVPTTKREYRDPRFEPLTGPLNESKLRAAYSFLDDYREDEMKDLRTTIKATKDEDAKEKLKRALLSMESKKTAQARKEKEREILDKHRKEEKELVKQGKKPFYLKKAEQKKRALLDQYGDLKGKQLDRVIERRRKKVEGKEKKRMPMARRGI